MLGRISSRSKAFVTFDGLFSIIPALVMIMFTMNVAHFLTTGALTRLQEQQVFDKLVSIADYVVKQGAAETVKLGNPAASIAGQQEVRYPNWVVRQKAEDIALANDLKAKANLNTLSISLDEPGNGTVCVYRIVVVDELMEQKKIEKLYVCGD